MFNLKTSFLGQKSEDKIQNTALPNSFGRVRTLKEDLDDLEKGKGKGEIEEETRMPMPPLSQNHPFPVNPSVADVPSSAGSNLPGISMPREAVAPNPALAPSSAANAKNNFPKESEKKETNPFPDSFGSPSYFEKSPFEEIKPSEDSKSVAASTKHESKTLIMVLSIIIAVAVLGGGFYYYWFIIKKSSPETSQEASQSVPTADTVSPIQKTQEPENKNLKHISLDLVNGPASFKSGIDKLASESMGSPSGSDLIEVNVLDKNNQAIKIKDFMASLGIVLTETISSRFLNNYTLFIKKDNSETRLGAVFELSGDEGLSGELSQQEKSLPSKFKSFYLKQVPPETEMSFSSSQYNGANIRFLNIPDLQNTSFDYSIVKGKQASYLIISTSKNTTRSILDYMAGK
jgi:hypothetical protein